MSVCCIRVENMTTGDRRKMPISTADISIHRDATK